MPGVLLRHVLAVSLLLLHVARVGHRLRRINPDTAHPIVLWHMRGDAGPCLLRWEVRVGGFFGRLDRVVIHAVLVSAGRLRRVQASLERCNCQIRVS